MGRKQTTKGRTGRNLIDVTSVLKRPVKVKKDGRQQAMSPYEVALRGQVKRAVAGNLPAIKHLLAEAQKHGLMTPPEQNRGGVLVVPGEVTKRAWEKLFSPQPVVPRTARKSRPSTSPTEDTK